MKKLFLLLLLVFVFGCANETQEVVSGEKEGFCGFSTFKVCSDNSECSIGGCSGQVCGASEDFVSTCEYRDCYDADAYNLKCKCVNEKCQWS